MGIFNNYPLPQDGFGCPEQSLLEAGADGQQADDS